MLKVLLKWPNALIVVCVFLTLVLTNCNPAYATVRPTVKPLVASGTMTPKSVNSGSTKLPVALLAPSIVKTVCESSPKTKKRCERK